MQPTILYKSNSKPLIHTHTRFTLSVSFCMTQLELKIVDRKKIHKFKLDPDSKFDCKHSRSVCLSVCFFPYLCKELYLQTNLTIATNRYAQIKNDTTWIQYVNPRNMSATVSWSHHHDYNHDYQTYTQPRPNLESNSSILFVYGRRL